MKINRNFYVSKLFADELYKLGIRYCCISPGSRSTPLALAFASINKLNKFVCIDERTSGFFALGLTQASKIPTVLICTSGTAAAEFYPAIIESYKNCFPLIVITADRPKGMSAYGASQTINQNGIYRNHIFKEFCIEVNNNGIDLLKKVKDIANDCYSASITSKKPVHINFHFDKPLESDSFTDDITNSFIKEIKAYKPQEIRPTEFDKINFRYIKRKISSTPKGIIIAGSELFDKKTLSAINKLSIECHYPIFAEVTSNLKNSKCKNLVSNIDSFLKYYTFPNGKPELIIHFGKSTFSKEFEPFLNTFTGEYIQVNEYNELYDPCKKVTMKVYQSVPIFCRELNFLNLHSATSIWLNDILNFDNTIKSIKKENLVKNKIPFEGNFYIELIKLLPDNCNIFLSNSLPIRDFNNYAGILSPNITIYNNRGAAGIDGIIATALGICEASAKSTILITGDLAFYYDLNSLLIAGNFNIPLIIILINNNGGGIFRTLPINGHFDEFEKYFSTPINLDFKKIVSAFAGNYFLIGKIKTLKSVVDKALLKKSFSVIEFRTNSITSTEIKNNIDSSIHNALLTS